MEASPDGPREVFPFQALSDRNAGLTDFSPHVRPSSAEDDFPKEDIPVPDSFTKTKTTGRSEHPAAPLE